MNLLPPEVRADRIRRGRLIIAEWEWRGPVKLADLCKKHGLRLTLFYALVFWHDDTPLSGPPLLKAYEAKREDTRHLYKPRYRTAHHIRRP